jgi:hypothetical protein
MAASLGKYFDQVNAGRVFIGSTAAAGVAFPISTGTAVTCAVWNTSTTHDAVLLRANVGYTSGTIALGEIGIANQAVGFNIATGAAMTAFTEGTPKNAKLGAGAGSRMKFTPSGATLAAGGTAVYWTGFSIESATAGLGIFNAGIDLDGSVIVTPGQIAFVCGSIAQTGVFTISLMWAEVEI